MHTTVRILAEVAKDCALRVSEPQNACFLSDRARKGERLSLALYVSVAVRVGSSASSLIIVSYAKDERDFASRQATTIDCQSVVVEMHTRSFPAAMDARCHSQRIAKDAASSLQVQLHRGEVTWYVKCSHRAIAIESAFHDYWIAVEISVMSVCSRKYHITTLESSHDQMSSLCAASVIS